MSLRNIKKLQSPDLLQQTDDSEESEAAPRKSANNFELVSWGRSWEVWEEVEKRNLIAFTNPLSSTAEANCVIQERRFRSPILTR